ncbi:hypothetical protein ATK30_2567 [Amycolatopsis echigonensis]|uniref:Uncharacterized protein n=1 Tax=Amycolatopsis echigonensis TaxID=2576905 RepID=A0A2N3WD19_9PSEU|nr:hypothetical protein ATK30_2567 [Amycolatopsis niigatensis]
MWTITGQLPLIPKNRERGSPSSASHATCFGFSVAGKSRSAPAGSVLCGHYGCRAAKTSRIGGRSVTGTSVTSGTHSPDTWTN